MQIITALRGAAVAALLLVNATLATSGASAQLGGLGRALGLGRVSGSQPQITTSLADARWGDASKDGFTPSEPRRPLMSLQRTPNGGFILQPGYYAMVAQSYCLHAGTYAPGSGDGYLYAPPLGPAADAVVTILRHSVQHPEIAQPTIQTLLWAILARAKIQDMHPDDRAAAQVLLTPAQIASLNRSALDRVPGPVLNAAVSRLPAPLRGIAQAEAQLRQMLTDPGSSYADMERTAVLQGPPTGNGNIPRGRWNLHPDGYYVRYTVSGYTTTLVEVYVPRGIAVGREYDPALHMVVPGTSGRQRLGESGRAIMNDLERRIESFGLPGRR